MRLPWPHRDGGPQDDRDRDDRDGATPAAPVPSPASTDRLAEHLHREIEDLHSELADDLLLTLILLGEDEVGGAVGLLEDGSDRLQRFQDRVEGVVADAAVERDAEAVLAAAERTVTPELAPISEPPRSSESTRPEPTRTPPGSAFRIRALASTAAAVLAAVVALVSIEPSGDPSLVAARTSSPAPAADRAQTSGDLATEEAREATTSATGDGQVSPTATTPSDRLEALRVIGDQGGILARLGSEPRRAAMATLFGVERLVGQVVVDARSVLPSEAVEVVTETLSEVEVPVDEASAEPATEPQPEPQPTTEEAPSERPSTEGTSSEEGSQEGSEPSSEETSEETSEGSDEGSEDDSDSTTGTLPGDTSGSWSAPSTDVEGSDLL